MTAPGSPWTGDLASQLAVRLSDRHFGIGGDGIILIEKGQNADFEMVMYNADYPGALCAATGSAALQNMCTTTS